MNEKYKKWKRRFIAFLKENGIYEKWVYNMKYQHPITDYEWWDYFADRIYANRCVEGINYAFTWSDTKDGHAYWRYYDIKWKSILGNGDIQKMF